MMKEWFLKTNINYINSKTDFDVKKMKVIKYGLECLYTIITKTTVVLLLSFLLHITKETILLLIFYAFLRMYGFGIHATKNLHCWIISLISYTLLPLIIKYLYINQLIIIIVEIIAFIGFLIWAPADTLKRPLINESKRKKDKLILLIISITYIIYSIFYNNVFSYCMMISMLLELICICPLTYMIFKQPYNNYKSIKLV